MLSKFPSKSYRVFLLPLAGLYQLVVFIRNKLFDKGVYKSTRFALPIIGVGNLSVGGTGKSPMVEYLIRLLSEKYKVATLSRGYKRKTKGYALANASTTELDIGDEPMQFHLKFPAIDVAVGEERIVAVPLLLQDRPGTEVIILDDALQHRSIQAGLDILLTSYSNPFSKDKYLPAGELRDLKSSYKRANIIVVTKCDPAITDKERKKLEALIRPLSHQSVYFTTTKYGNIHHLITNEMMAWENDFEVLIVTGIANPDPLMQIIEKNSHNCSLMRFADHHIYTIDDLKNIRKKFDAIQNKKKIILTTQKDAVRLQKFKKDIEQLPIYFVEISHVFLFDEGDKFDTQLLSFVHNFKKIQ